MLVSLIGDHLVAQLSGGRFRVVKRLLMPAAKRRALFEALISNGRPWPPIYVEVPAGTPSVPAGTYRFHLVVNRVDPDLGLPGWLTKQIEPADEREEGESRSKDTDEVSEASDSPSEDAEVHGGDGNSGEVDSPAETSGEDRSGPDSPEGEDSHGEQSAGPQPVDLSQAGEDDPAKSEEDKRREQLAEQYAPARQKMGDEVFRNGPNASVVQSEVVEPPAAVGKDLKKVLTRLFKGWSSESGEDTGGQMTSPRVDGAALVREMATGRWNMSRVFRQEIEERPRTIMVAADVSGSCSAASGHTVGICQALTKVWPELLFVTHANGNVETVTRNGVTESIERRSPPRIVDLVKGHKILGVLLFGDADGLSELEPVWLDERCQVIWLDSYCASYGKVFETSYRKVYGSAGGTPATLRPEGGDPVYFGGVGCHHSASVALRMALRY
jgi:hypothetical protein